VVAKEMMRSFSTTRKLPISEIEPADVCDGIECPWMILQVCLPRKTPHTGNRSLSLMRGEEDIEHVWTDLLALVDDLTFCAVVQHGESRSP